jgi:hypothetical protein
MVLNPTAKKQTLRYNINIKDSGKYTLYTYFIKRGESSKKSVISVVANDQKEQVVIDADNVVIKGQTTSAWVPIGEYDLQQGGECYVEYTNEGDVTGQIVADAVLAVKQ